jgi:hypothetical protein
MLLVDTKILVDLLQDDTPWANWSIGQLPAQASIHQRIINPVIGAETSRSFSTPEGLDSAVSTLALELRQISRPALFLAAKAEAKYLKRGRGKLQVLPDFFIGADAALAVSGHTLLIPPRAAPPVALGQLATLVDPSPSACQLDAEEQAVHRLPAINGLTWAGDLYRR